MMQNILKRFGVYLFFLLLSLIIILIWFKDGKLIASGEEGLQFYNPKLTAYLYSYHWYDLGTGISYNLGTIRAPIFIFASFISLLTSNIISQSVIYFFLLFSAFIGVYFLVKDITKNKYIAMTSSLFYFFNLYSMSQVWGRMILSGNFFWSYLPTYILLLKKWLEKGRIKDLILINLTSLIFLHLFGHPSFTLSFLITSIVIGLYFLFSTKEKLTVIKRGLLFGFSFLIINIWWIYPYLTLSSDTFSAANNWRDNLGSLDAISEYISNFQLILLRQKFLFEKSGYYGNFYKTGATYLISIINFIFVIFGIIRSRHKKYFSFVLTLFITFWFMCKGLSFPFGKIFYTFLFSNIPIMALLRNPYEKLGSIFLLQYVIFVSVGFIHFVKISEKSLRVAIYIVVLVLNIYLTLPLVTGKLFNNMRVSIPAGYNELNNYINSNNSLQSRVILFPMVFGEGSTFTWNYSGSDPGQYFFNTSVISKVSDGMTKYYYNNYKYIYDLAENGDDLDTALVNSGVGFVITRNDLVTEGVNPDSGQYSDYKFVDNFSDFKLYQSNKPVPLVTLSGNNLPEYSYKKITPKIYEVNVSDATEPFTLILLTSYNKRWDAKNENESFGSNNLAHNYANSWNINKTGNFKVIIKFRVWPWD